MKMKILKVNENKMMYFIFKMNRNIKICQKVLIRIIISNIQNYLNIKVGWSTELLDF